MNENQENPSASSVKMYKLFVNNTEYGPYTEEQLHRMVSSGQVSADTLVWTAGMPTWTPYRDAFSAPAHPVPPPAAQEPVQKMAGKIRGTHKAVKSKKKIIIAVAGAVVLAVCGVVVSSKIKASQAEKNFDKGIYYLINDSDWDAALPFIRDAAKAGHTNAMYYYAGWLLLKGNKSEALEWIEKAADKGHIFAMLKYCEALYYGKGVKQDEKKALKLAIQMYKKGFLMYGPELHDMVAKELNLPVEIVSAIKHFGERDDKTSAKLKKLADNGDAMAALLYALTAQNEKEMEKYLSKAASKGNIFAKKQLLELYRDHNRDKEALQIYKEFYDNGLLDIFEMGRYRELEKKVKSRQ